MFSNNNNNNSSNDEYPGNDDSFIGNTNNSNYSGNNNFPPNNNNNFSRNNNNNNNNNSFSGNNNNSNYSGNNFSGNNNYSDNNYDDDDDNSYYGNSDGMQGPNNNSSFFSESENCDQQQQQQQQDDDEEDVMNNSDSGNDNSAEMVIKLRGLPWSSTVDDILSFFEGVRINGERDGIHLVSTTEGRSSGEAFVEVDDMDMPEAIKRDKKNIGHRYIEVFKVKRAEMEWVLERSNVGNNHSNMNSFRNNNSDDNETCVRMRGLPFECSKEEIARFFNGLDVVNISIQYSNVGRATGECYVKFRNKEITEKALLRDRNCIKHRYIEIFRVGATEMRIIEQSNARPMVNRNNRPPQFNRPGPYDRDRGNNPNGPNNRYGSNQQQRQNRYFGKGNGGFDEDTWNNYANEVGPPNNWNNRGKKSGPPNRRNNNYNSNANVILMRGLPFKANENDIRKFFDPLVPMNIEIIYDSTGRPSGTAKVQFGSGDDMTRAMGKHKEKIFTRYIELFVNAS